VLLNLFASWSKIRNAFDTVIQGNICYWLLSNDNKMRFCTELSKLGHDCRNNEQLKLSMYLIWWVCLPISHNFCQFRTHTDNATCLSDSMLSLSFPFPLPVLMPETQVHIPFRSKKFFSTPQWPDQLWGPPSLLPKG
jgi:hypothetical protein